jgi:hypothetical protein
MRQGTSRAGKSILTADWVEASRHGPCGNERDPILKERLFGLTNSEANHGEDVKEYYFYLDSMPTQSYMKYLYKYPQREYPYQDLIETNRSRSREEFEYELLALARFDPLLRILPR